MLDPFAIPRYLLFVLAWWTRHVGAKGVLGLLAVSAVLAVIANYTLF